MDKAGLVMDMPDSCLDCMFCYELDEGIEACCSITCEEKDNTLYKEINCEDGYCQNKPNWCPLKELPERRKYGEEFFNGDVKGWNDCLKTIFQRNKI